MDISTVIKKCWKEADRLFLLAVNWKYANWVIAFLLVVVGIMLNVARFGLALPFLIASAIWTDVLYWRSQFVKVRQKVGGRRKLVLVPSRRLQIGGIIVINFIYGIAFYVINAKRVEQIAPPISISPSAVEFHNLPNETYDFTIADNKDKDVYMVAMKFVIENKSDHSVYRISEHNVKTPTIVWKCQDAKGRSLFLLAVNRIPAHDSIDLRVIREAPTTDTLMTTKVNYFTYSPTSFSAVSASSIGMFMRPEENLNNCQELGGASSVPSSP